MKSIQAACKLFKVKKRDIYGNNKTPPLPQARHFIIFYHRMMGDDWADAGMVIGKRAGEAHNAVRCVNKYCNKENYLNQLDSYLRLVNSI